MYAAALRARADENRMVHGPPTRRCPCRRPLTGITLRLQTAGMNLQDEALVDGSRDGRLVFVLAGQSNMAGRAALPSTAAADTTSTIRNFHQEEDIWQDACEPLHADKPAPKPGMGPGLHFARELIRMDDIAASCGIGLIPCAVGGSELARWEEDGDLRRETLRRVQLALEQDRTSRLAGILWHQGESDAADTRDATVAVSFSEDSCRQHVKTEFASRLISCLASLRASLYRIASLRDAASVGTNEPEALPIITGELGYFLLEHGDKDHRFCLARSINDGIIQAASAIPCCDVVSAHGLGHRGDRLHFDGPAVEEMGARYALAWMDLARAGNTRPTLPLGFPVMSATPSSNRGADLPTVID